MQVYITTRWGKKFHKIANNICWTKTTIRV
uniref:Uncharacterized protein n=1 Tax=Arundo donax TaxID=35708 RepID=A0A0A8Y1G0_ARUDO